MLGIDVAELSTLRGNVLMLLSRVASGVVQPVTDHTTAMLIDGDRQLHHLRLLRKEYEQAIREETDSLEQWRLRRVLHELHCFILELETKKALYNPSGN